MAIQAAPTTEHSTDRPPRPRRWIPLSLRMFVAMLALIGIGSILWIGLPIYRQKIAIREIERLRGWACTESKTPKWVTQNCPSAGILFDDIEAVYIVADSSYDHWYWHGMRFERLRRPSGFDKTGKATDSDLERIGRLKGLSTLMLGGSAVSDAGLVHLQELHGLSSLSLAGSSVTDAGLSYLASLKHLSYLSLEDTHITDEGLARLKSLPNLDSLLLDGNRITDAGIRHLADFPKISYVSVRRTGVTDNGVEEMRQSQRLRISQEVGANTELAEMAFALRRVFIMK